MAISSRKITAYTKTHQMLPPVPSPAYSATQLQQWYDTAPEEARLALNGLIDDLLATTAGSSGAHNIGSATINGVVGNNVFEQLLDIKAQLNSAAAGSIPPGSITETLLSQSVNEKLVPYGGTTTNAGNAYSISYTISSLTTGMGISLKINANSTGASTLNWDGKGAKPIKKPNGLDATLLKAGGLYTVRYDGTNFILQGEGGEYGSATTGDVLAPQTIGTEDGVVTGTLSLTGTAADADVLANKTYYGTDAKTKRTGTLVKGFPVGDGVIVNAATQRVGAASTTYAKIKAITINAESRYRVSFEFQTSSGGSLVYGRIYKNGVAYGTERSISTTPFVTYTEDLFFSAGDTCELWIHGDGTFGAAVQNFRLKTLLPTVTLD